MAFSSAYTPSAYSSVQNAYSQMMGQQPMGATGTTSFPRFDGGADLSGSSGGGGPVNYSQPISSLRAPSDVTNISTFGDLSPSQRIATLADRKFQEAEATRLASNQLGQSIWNSNLGAVRSLSKGDQGFIFNAMRNAGLVPLAPTQAGTEDYKFRQQNPWYQQNLNTLGVANRANLASIGINPNSVSQAYKELMGKRY